MGTIQEPPVRRARRLRNQTMNRMNRKKNSGATKSSSVAVSCVCGFRLGFQSAASVVSAVTMSSTARVTPPS